MHDHGTGLAEPRAFALRQMDAMAEQAAAAQEAEAIVHIRVVARARVERFHHRHLAGAFGQMSLHVDAGMRPIEIAGSLELRFRGGDGEARRHGIAQAAAAMPFLDQGLAVAGAGGGIVAHRVRCVTVHQGLAGDQRHRALLRRGEKRFRRNGMDRAIGRCRRGAVTEQAVEEDLGRGSRMGRIAIARLLGEGEAIQPFQQIRAGRRQHAVLGKMDMGIDEARQDQIVTIIVDRQGTMCLWQIGEVSGPGDAARAIQRNRALPVKDMGVLGRNVMGIGAKAQYLAAQHTRLDGWRGVHAFTRPSRRK